MEVISEFSPLHEAVSASYPLEAAKCNLASHPQKNCFRSESACVKRTT